MPRSRPARARDQVQLDKRQLVRQPRLAARLALDLVVTCAAIAGRRHARDQVQLDQAQLVRQHQLVGLALDQMAMCAAIAAGDVVTRCSSPARSSRPTRLHAWCPTSSSSPAWRTTSRSSMASSCLPA